MAKFIQFVMVTPEECYPAAWADEPIFDVDGSELSCAVDHPNHVILINPHVRRHLLEAEIDYATNLARQTLQLPPFRRVAVLGDVD